MTDYTDAEAVEARQWSNRHGPPNAWTASFGTAARMIGRLLDERERLMAKQAVAAPGDDYIREWHEEFQRWKAVAEEKQGLRDHFAAAALTGLANIEPESASGRSDIAYMAYALADAMLRERCRGGGDCPGPDNAPNHDAAPAATVSGESVVPQPTPRGDSDRRDKAAPRPSAGTGDTQEPVAWGVEQLNGEFAVVAFTRPRADEYATASDRVVPLFRHPQTTLTDAEREAVEAAVGQSRRIGTDCAVIDTATLRGLLRRLGGGK